MQFGIHKLRGLIKQVLLLSILSIIACRTEVPNPPSESELVTAVMARQAGKADSLLTAGASPQSQDEEGTPVLILAVNRGLDDVVKKLVTAGADVNARRAAYFKSTALMEVGVRNNPELAGWLLDQGADLHARDTLGDTALNWAAFYGHEDLVALYLDRGADLLVAGRQGSAIDIALHRGHEGLIQLLIRRGAGKAISPEAKAFIRDVEKGDLDGVATALEKGISPDQTDEIGSPALVLAAGAGQEDVVRYLLRKGADKEAMNRVGETALARAARFGHESVVNRLLSVGVDPELAGEQFGITPLIAAAQTGQTVIIRELIASHVNPDRPEHINGYTPLMLATAGGYADAVRALLAEGASPYVKSYEGAGLYDMLRYSNNAEIGAIIQEALLEND
ncbi:MAG: ankyrin repeat domain-containing protein [Saprospiraceae bacterium]|nr:ankyrin repeat domain-containing protein [Lewinella sp.]